MSRSIFVVGFRVVVLLCVGLVLPGMGIAASIQYFDGTAVGISADGTTLLMRQTDPGTLRIRSVVWSADLGKRSIEPWFEDMETLVATDLSADGKIIVGFADDTAGVSPAAVRWTKSRGIERLPGSGPSLTIASAISADGSRILGSQWASYLLGRPQSLVWDRAGKVSHLTEDARASIANGISYDGRTIVGREALSSGWIATRWRSGREAERLIPLDLDLVWSEANVVSGDGAVVFGRYKNRDRVSGGAFRWTKEIGFEDLGSVLPGATFGTFEAASRDGRTAVGTAQSNRFVWRPSLGALGWSEAVVWDEENGARILEEVLIGAGVDLHGINLVSALGVSADGRKIIGSTATGATFLAMIPEPAPGLLLGLGLLYLGTWRLGRASPGRRTL